MAPILAQRLWRARKLASSVLSCGLYLNPHGIEARSGYGNEDNLLMSSSGSNRTSKPRRIVRLP
jgi:hypothetical protein